MVRDACARGGQAEAKKVMKASLYNFKAKAREVTGCKSCHTALSPDFKLTSNALELYTKGGGK